MATRPASVAAACMSVALVLGSAGAARGDDADDARKNAKRVSSYVLLAEAITRISLQVGDLLNKNPYDRALATYARELGKLHAKLYAKLTAPPGAEDLHAKFKEAVAGFSKSATAHAAADYKTARKYRDESLREFTRALGELAKLKQEGTLP